MLQLIEKLDILKENLNKLDLFDKLQNNIENINNNKELLKKIEDYHNNFNEHLKIEIYKYDEIKEYKKLENEVNFLVLEINQKLKRITDIRSCKNESN